MNNMLYTRGNREDFDKWQALGNEGWAAEDVWPYFEKAEGRKTSPRRQFQDTDEETVLDGPLNIELPRYRTGLLPVYLKAAQELGQKLIDYSRETQIGIGLATGSTVNGRRVSAAEAYIYPIYKDRPNLHILTSAQATKILINETTKAAHAVQYVVDGVQRIVASRKEIILSAGAIGSPHLLMLSGVGREEMLKKANITMVQELPVGESFHVGIAVQAPHILVNTSALSLHIKRISINSFLQFRAGQGALTSFTGTEALSFLKTPSSDLPPGQPDVELQFVSAGVPSDLGMGFRKVAQIKESVYAGIFKPIENPDLDIWSTIVMNLHSQTKGSLEILDNSIDTDPVLKYPFFEDRNDIASIIYGIKEALRIAQTKAFRMIGARAHGIPLPSCAHLPMVDDDDEDDDRYWDCYVRHVTTIAPQMVATNRMGPRSDPEAVVDAQLKVHGIKMLRVADTSVIPTTISGHLQAASYMIGEKLAASLKRAWKSIPNEIP